MSTDSQTAKILGVKNAIVMYALLEPEQTTATRRLTELTNRQKTAGSAAAVSVEEYTNALVAVMREIPSAPPSWTLNAETAAAARKKRGTSTK